MDEKITPEADAATNVGEGEKPIKVRFHCVKSSAFRSIHADGVFGGVTPRLTIAATFYNERQPIPDQMVYAVKEDGTTGDEIRDERISRDGFVRELEANVILDVNLAKALVIWLNEKIEVIEQRLKEIKEEQKDQEATEIPQ
jgi:hypothetical protein